MKKPAIDKILQISIVVDDLDKYMKTWNDIYGIGPWIRLNFNENTLDKQRIEDAPGKWGIRMALCDALNVQIELIEPVYGDTSYSQFLEKHGPGLHHLAIAPNGGFPEWKKSLEERGKLHFIVGGNEFGEKGEREFEYVDLSDELGCIMETYYDTNGFIPGPNPAAGMYPAE